MGYKLKDRREELRMSQEELSAKSGISRQTISSLENNQNKNVSTRVLASLARALDTTIGDLFLLMMPKALDEHKSKPKGARSA